MNIVWQTPPATKSGRGKTNRAALVAELKKHPGEWALYPVPMSSAAGYRLASTFDGVEVTTRKRPDGKYNIYVRWAPSEAETTAVPA